MSYQVTAPLVIIPNVDGTTGDGYFYQDGIVPDGWNDERCKVLAEEGMLAKGKASEVVETEEPPGPPAKSASKGEWEAYARTQGATDDDLKDVTKDDLVATYGE